MAKLHRVLFVLSLVVSLSVFAQSADQQFLSGSDSPDPVVPGNNITYTIQMRNNGPDPAVNGGLNGNLDGGLAFVSATGPAGFSCLNLGNNFSCTNPSWASGNTATFTVVAQAPVHLLNFPDGSFTSNFFTSGVTPDPNNGNNSGSVTTAYDSPQIDLSLTVTDSPDPVAPDGLITYTVPVTNGGPNNATNASFSVYNAQGLQYQSISAPAGWNCTLPAVGGSAIFSCAAATVVPGTQNFTVVLKAPLAVIGPSDTTVTTAFGVSGTGNDTNTGNNNENETTGYVTPDADMGISVTDSPDPVNPDGNITYTITVTNSGPDAATNAQMSVYNNGSLQYQSLSAPAVWNCSPPAVNSPPTLSCSLASFPSGGTAVFTLVAQADATLNGIFDHTITTSFTAGSSLSDPNSGNNAENEDTLYTTADADMGVSVTDSPDPVNPDGNITYTITVTNNGPDAAPNAQLSIYNEGNLQFQSVSAPAGWTCTPPSVNATPTFSCSNPSFANGGSSVFTLVAQADATLNGIFDHAILTSFTATSSVSDPVNTNNSETESTQYVTPDADVAVSVTDSPDPVAPDGNITYTITVTNNGPDAAPSAQLSIYNEGNLQFQSVSAPAGWTCTPPSVNATPTFTCTNPSFANGGSSVFTLVAQADSTLNGIFDHAILTGFTVTSSVSDPVNTNNSETESTQYSTPDADLSVSVTDSPDPVAPDGNITYTITVANAGPDAAANAVLGISTPSGLQFQSITTPAGWSCSAPAVDALPNFTCTNPSFASGASVNFILVAQADATLNGPNDGTIQATFGIGTSTADPDSTDNTETEYTAYVTPDADISVTNSDSPDPVNYGENITYTQTLTNNGPATANQVGFSEELQSNVGFVSFSAPAGWSCTTPVVGGYGTINCTTATLASGATANFTLVVQANAGNVVTNIVNGGSATQDPDLTDNGAAATTAIIVPQTADTSISKTTSSSSAAPGGSVTYTITVSNAGPDAATNVVMTDTLPTSLLFQSITQPAGFSCTTPAAGSTGTITCTAATMAPSTNAVFTLVTQVAGNATGTINNSASVSSDADDTATGNDSGSATGVVVGSGSSDLGVTKTTPTTSAAPGDSVTYTITIHNAGPDAATDVTMSDTLPPSLLFQSINAPAGFICSTPAVGSTGTVSCIGGSIANGGNAVFTLVTTIAPGASGSVANGVTVTSANADPDPTDSTTTTPGIIVGSADLSITKTTNATSAPTGSTINYTITVTNNGPDAATSVIVSDDLPAGLSLISATPSQGSCNASDPVSCNLGTLNNGASATITIQALVTATSGTITNTATVDSATDDPNGGNNSGSGPATPVVPGGAGEATGIPTLSEWAMIGLALMLGVIAMRKMA